MLEYNTWTTEQRGWDPQHEPEVEQQLSFSNDYLCQTAHFEEHYAAPQRLCTYIKGVEKPIPNISSISLRLHDERLDLADWQVENFHRRLHKNEPLLERSFTACSPKGFRLNINVSRELLPAKKEAMQIIYSVQSVNYNGPISLLALLGGGEEAVEWYPLMNFVGQDLSWMWLQMRHVDLQLCCAMNYAVFKNGEAVQHRPIKIEKQHIVGYSATLPVQEGETYVLQKRVVVQDSRYHGKDTLIDSTTQCLTNW